MPADIYLEPDDEIGVITGKISAANERVVTIVAPRGQLALRKAFNLRILRRHLARTGVHALLVSSDPEARSRAAIEGLPAADKPRKFRNRQEIEPSGWHTGALQAGPAWGQASGRTSGASWGQRLVVGGCMVFALGLPLFFASVFMPRATVTLYPDTKQFKDVYLVNASPLANGLEPAKLILPARSLEVDFDVSVRAATAGKRDDPAGAARGSVTFVNKTDQPVAVFEGTQVSTASGLIFKTVRSVTVPSDGSKSASTQVIAAKAGEEGNVSVGEITQFADTALSGKISVGNNGALAGGKDAEIRVVGEKDYHDLREKALALATEQATKKMREQEAQDYSFFPGTTRWRIYEEVITPSVGEGAWEVSLSMRGTARLVVFSGHDVNQLLIRHVEGSDRGAEVIPNTLSTRVLGISIVDGDAFSFEIEASGSVTSRVSESEVKQLIRGKTPQEAKEALRRNLSLTRPSTIITSPFWVQSIPEFTWQIRLHQEGRTSRQ